MAQHSRKLLEIMPRLITSIFNMFWQPLGWTTHKFMWSWFLIQRMRELLDWTVALLREELWFISRSVIEWLLIKTSASPSFKFIEIWKFEVKKQYKIYLVVSGSIRLSIEASVWKLEVQPKGQTGWHSEKVGSDRPVLKFWLSCVTLGQWLNLSASQFQ